VTGDLPLEKENCFMDYLRNKHLILAADDSPTDRRILQEAFRDVDTSLEVEFVEDGAQLLEYLRGNGSRRRPPSLVLLDLSMPHVDGRKALAAMKTDPRLRLIPVIVLTGSQEANDISSVYDEGGTTYMFKPQSFEGLVQVVATLCQFWFQTSRLPEPD
jgi:two-component system, response regulator